MSNINPIGLVSGKLKEGVVKHECGGLEADVSAYNGLVKISSGSTSAVSLPLSVANGGTGQSSALTAKGLIYANGTSVMACAGASDGLNWDYTNKRLGIGTDAPGYAVDCNGTIRAYNSSSTPLNSSYSSFVTWLQGYYSGVFDGRSGGVNIYDQNYIGSNIVSGGGMETLNLTEWTTEGTGSVTRDGTVYHDGSYSAKLTQTAQMYQTISMKLGKAYVLRGWIRKDAGAGVARFGLRVGTGTYRYQKDYADNDATWHYLNEVYIAQGDETRLYLYNPGGDASTVTYFDTIGIYPITRGDIAVNGYIYNHGIITGTGTAIYVDSNNKIVKDTSSRRYKNNISDIEKDTSKIYDLRPVSFSLHNDSDNRRFGLIAEEVYDVIPELVNLNENGEPESVNYSILSVLLLCELKKLKKKIEKLEAKP